MVGLLAAESSNDLIKVVPGLMIWTIVTFLIVLWFLRRFAFGPVQGIMWLGFALTEAVVFYGLIGGLLAYVLI